MSKDKRRPKRGDAVFTDCMDWLMRLRTAWHDADAVSADMLRRPRYRRLGPAQHRELYAEAADKIEKLLAAPPEPFDDTEAAEAAFARQ